MVVTIGFLITDYIGLSRAGFEDPTILSQRNFYQNTANYSAIIILLFFVMSFILKRGDDKYGNSIGFASQGKTPHLSFFSRFTYPQLTLYFLILFLWLGLFNFTQFPESKTYTGVGLLESQ